MPSPHVVAVARDDRHRFSKPVRDAITLVAGHGVEGDAHAGATVQHRFDARRDPTRPNLRQVHLIHAELLDDLTVDVAPGDLGENVTTAGVALLELARGTRLRLGDEAVVEVTGLRSPCRQIDRLSPGLMRELVGRDADGRVVRRTGVMAVVLAGGVVRPGDAIVVEAPEGAHEALEPV
ncbi:MOSC domain-containing protein [Agrococcus versicolor]